MENKELELELYLIFMPLSSTWCLSQAAIYYYNQSTVSSIITNYMSPMLNGKPINGVTHNRQIDIPST